MARNRIVNKLKSRIPYLGNNQALKNHIANALRNAGDLSVVIRNIDAIPKENMDSLTKTGLEKFKTEIIPEIRQIIKETQGEAAEQGSKLEQAEAKQEVVKGEGWTMRDGGEAKQYAEHKFELEKWINDLSGVLSDEWIANLKSLALKHPEMFKSEADVFRVIKEIKDNPTHFFKNNNDRNALLVKNLKEGKSGEIAVRKTDGQIVHATINNEKRLDRLQKRNKENLGNGKLSKVEYSDGARRLPRHSDQSRTMPTAKAESAADDAGIIQTFARPGSKLENRGLGYQDETIISQNSAKDEEAIKTYVNPHVGAGLAGGTLNAKDENGNFDAEKFAKGFIYGLFGSKVTAATLKKTNSKLYDQIVKIGEGNANKEKISSFVNKLKQDELGKLLQKTITNKDLSTKTKVEIIEAAKKRFAKETPKSLNEQSEAQMIVKDKDQKEKRGIYNVAYNDKKSTIIYKDLEAIENAIKFEKGFENKVTKKGFGALHIEKHLNEKNAGWVTQQEYLNMGEVVRKGKLNTDKYGRRSYEYYKNGIRFRVAIGYTGKGKDRVISFFSDRKPKK